ncbi:MAG: hypothetical protein K0R61_5606 [Microvirga sp.]|jgi:hypothetical protein|nr:hypothetical protein [Microvirga sp.]
MAEDEPEQEELEAQMAAAMEAIRATILQLLKEGRVHPQLLILAVAHVAGELGASAALASGQDAEALLGELADVVRQAGREQQEMLQAELLPVAGSA